jgi:hypothetical protein
MLFLKRISSSICSYPESQCGIESRDVFDRSTFSRFGSFLTRSSLAWLDMHPEKTLKARMIVYTDMEYRHFMNDKIVIDLY